MSKQISRAAHKRSRAFDIPPYREAVDRLHAAFSQRMKGEIVVNGVVYPCRIDSIKSCGGIPDITASTGPQDYPYLLKKKRRRTK